MKTIIIKDLMVPLEEYATVSEDATLQEAVMALEAAQEKIDREKYKYLHRAILVLNRSGKVVGKISQLDALKALEPKYREIGDPDKLARAGFSPAFLKILLEKHSFWDSSLADICRKCARLKVKNFMHTPTEGEYVRDDATLAEALHMLVMGRHHSLLVVRNSDIVGILRLTDVFVAVFDMMKQCET
ncbi:MAG: CBS domain-containing protein [Deltaproteobacteria bacterium]|nr:CBS domain-containing protein [Deltaproteobacteria bacterium]MBW1924783.1 CBS domain-containing protein [Deltaproteobacteria bacterium]RLB33272.1 MAG: CBS domain-containing protein [Deltaproteobacteria bacterium]